MRSPLEMRAADASSNASEPAIASYSDPRPRSRRLAAPVATAVASAVGLSYVAAVDPSSPGHYPLCPTQALLGVDCPGCGMIRGTHELLGGDIPRALDHNLLLIVLAPLAVLLMIGWVRRAWTGEHPAVSRRALALRTAALVAGLIGLAVFGVLRNLVPYLGSGIG